MTEDSSFDVTPALAAQLKHERRLHGLTHDDVALRGGPSSPTLTKIEDGEGRIRPKTAEKLEHAFNWGRGSIARMARGEAPIALGPIGDGSAVTGLEYPADLISVGVTTTDPTVLLDSVYILLTQAKQSPPGPYHYFLLSIVRRMLRDSAIFRGADEAERQERERAKAEYELAAREDIRPDEFGHDTPPGQSEEGDL